MKEGVRGGDSVGREFLGGSLGKLSKGGTWDLGGDVPEGPPVQAHRSRYV